MCGGMYTKWDCFTEEERRNIRSNASRKAWVTRRANARRRTLSERATKAWITRRANEYFGTVDQSTVTERLSKLY